MAAGESQETGTVTSGAPAETVVAQWTVEKDPVIPARGLFAVEMHGLQRMRLLPLNEVARGIAELWIHGNVRVSLLSHGAYPEIVTDALELQHTLSHGVMMPPQEAQTSWSDRRQMLGHAVACSHDDYKRFRALKGIPVQTSAPKSKKSRKREGR